MATGEQDDDLVKYSSDTVSGRVAEKKCDVCVRNMLSNKAKLFCSACTESICDDCIVIHLRDTSKKHVIVDVQSVDEENYGVNMNGLDLCKEHLKVLKFYCENHKQLCCSKCVMVHRKCDDFIEITICSEEDRKRLQDMKSAVLKANEDTFSLLQKVNQAKHSYVEAVEGISKDVDKTRDDILKVFEDATHMLMKEVDSMNAEKMKTLDLMNKALSSIRTDIAKVLPVCSNVLDKGTPQQMFIFVHTTANILNEAAQQLELERNLHPLPPMKVQIADDIDNLIQMGNKLMKLHIGEEIPDKDKGQPEIINSVMQQRPVTLQLLESADIVKSKGDKNDPFVTGLDFLPDGRLVAVDHYNNKCFLMNSMLQRKGQPYTFKTTVFDVRCVFHFLIAVSTVKQICILAINADSCTIIHIKRIDTTSRIFSISNLTPSNMVVSTYADYRSARMISFDGIEKDFDNLEFPKKTYNFDESKCLYAQSNNTLVLTDTLANTVYMYDTLKGTSRAVTDDNIQQPTGACVGPDDTVLVCSMRKNSIVHLTVEGDILGIYPVDMAFPYAVCTNTDRSTLVVSNCINGIRKLQLYKISPACF
ncbi:uncharacterized protein LOC127836472 [Dreissena polymorpha]|uniref:B box-type domain-containing protein n=1 Tax=Dreissena polymorpha TaxID=45954 RepID=A0A9D4JGS2_DREPO|nr:uncharacterized protein LOC127836472 [Dreissena polymorpha]KAH3807037.1 hypothetical protein DPMN_135369 [Dreissena polymorpha]